jgi:hypothetical protein
LPPAIQNNVNVNVQLESALLRVYGSNPNPQPLTIEGDPLLELEPESLPDTLPLTE